MLQETAMKAAVIAALFLSIPLSAQNSYVYVTSTDRTSSLTSPDGNGATPVMTSIGQVSAIANAPFSARVEIQITHPSHEENTRVVVTKYAYKIARDASGRTYNDHHLGVYGAGPEAITGDIYDPATRLDTYLIGEQQIAQRWRKSEGELPEYERNPRYDRNPTNAEPPFMVNGEWVWRKEDLGTQMMEGVTVHGVRLIRSFPAPPGRTGQPFETFDEFWYSSELHLNLLVKHTDPRTGEEKFAVTNLNRGDPDPLLFQVPEGFRIVDLTPKTSQK